MRVEIDPVAECLNGRDNPGHKLAPGDYLEVTGHRPEGAATLVLRQEPVEVVEQHPIGGILSVDRRAGFGSSLKPDEWSSSRPRP